MTEGCQAGEVLDGRYRLVAPLGRGGFGDVWRAEELLPDGGSLREVALKIMRGRNVGSDWSAEARIIASLRHPALVTIYAAGLIDIHGRAQPFVAMELLIGKSLAAFVKRGERVAWRRVLAWARQAAAALDEIHRAGVVHLDLKPANLFLPSDGAGVKVLDFGIARRGAEGFSQLPEGLADDMSTAAFMVARSDDAPAPPDGATTRAVVGTPGFMAPEIFEDGEATPAADAYALAACIVQLATGQLPQAVDLPPDSVSVEPARATSAAWLSSLQAATLRGQMRDLRGEHPDLPEALVLLLDRWLALDPGARGEGPLREALDRVWECPHGSDGNPYRGLSAYTARDEGLLFCRDVDAQRIARELVDMPAAVLQAEGGAGMRSLALAGVVPLLAKHFADDCDDWVAWEIAAAGDLARHLQLDDDATPPARLTAALDDRVASTNIGVALLIDEGHRLIEGDDAAIRQVIERVLEGWKGVRVITTLRSEEIDVLLRRDRELAALLRPYLRYVGPIGAGGIDSLIAGPARIAEREVGQVDAVVAEIGKELALQPAHLAFVSLALAEWWDAAAELDDASWRERGGVRGCIGRHADRTYATLSGEDKSRSDALLLRLISADGDAVAQPVEEAVAEDDRPVLTALVDARLLRRRGDEVELGHTALASYWRRLGELRLQNVDRLAFREDLRAAADRWHQAGRVKGHLWPAEAMRELDQRRGDLDDLNDEERDFVAASQRARRVALFVRALAVVALVTVVVGGLAVQAVMDERAEAHAARLAEARRQRAVDDMIARARRADDPYVRTALLAAAFDITADPSLALDLHDTVAQLPSQATFLTMRRTAQPSFPWGDRWMLSNSRTHVTVADFDPPAGADFAPMVFRFAPPQGVHALIPFGFDTAMLQQGQDGSLAVLRLRDDGSAALAAMAPMKCERGLGQVLAAEEAPVVACATEAGIALWDLRQHEEMRVDPFVGRVAHVSRAGDWVAATRLHEVLFWQPASERRVEIEVVEPPRVVRFSPRDQAVALVHRRRFEIYDIRGEPELILERPLAMHEDPVDARWDAGGLDLTVCAPGHVERHYLRSGGRDPADAEPEPAEATCERHPSDWPQSLDRALDYGLIGAEVERAGPRVFDGGWRLRDGRLLTGDLVLFDGNAVEIDEQLIFRATARGELDPPGSSVRRVLSDGPERVVFQINEEIRLVSRDGKVQSRDRGHLLARCSDDTLLAWRKADDGSVWEIVDARRQRILRRIERRPGFVIGADPGCERVYVQWLDGSIAYVAVDGPAQPVAATPLGQTLAGYVYDARPSAGWSRAGLWLAVSDGSIHRLDAGGLTAFGVAQPLATAMADGRTPSSLLFADETGLTARELGGEGERLLHMQEARELEDILLLGDGDEALVSWPGGVALVSLRGAGIVRELKLHSHRDRITPWNDEGSVLVWGFSFMGPAEGDLLPLGRPDALALAASVSNLRARLDENHRVVLRLR